MPLLGQASGGWTESSSALRLLHVGVRNSTGILSDDAFTQTNPPIVTATATISDNVDTSVLGVLSGSVAFTRPDQGSNYIGGPVETGVALSEQFVKPLGLFLNSAAGNAFENQPGPASGKNTYASSQGTHASQLFETQALGASGGAAGLAAGDALTYAVGQDLIASRNGYLLPSLDGSAANEQLDVALNSSQVANGQTASTTIAVLKMPADAVQNEIVFDQRI